MPTADESADRLREEADALFAHGLLSQAADLYRRIVTLRPDDEHALIRAGEVASAQGRPTEAHAYFAAAADLRAMRGDASGAADIRARIDSLELDQVLARLTIARTRASGDRAGRAADTASTPPARHLFDIYLQSGELDDARRSAATADQWETLAAALAAAGRHDEATGALEEAARREPDNVAVRRRLAHAFVQRGDARRAAEYLTVDMAGSDPLLRLTVAEIQLRAGHVEGGLPLAERLVREHPALAEHVARLAREAAPHAPDAAFRLAELAAEAWVAQSQWRLAVAALQDYVNECPDHTAALIRLVEIAVDGGVASVASHAQAKLIDTYLAKGAATEALVAAEDLAQREPWNPGHIERLRRALRLAGDPNPDAAIIQRLSSEALPPVEPSDRTPRRAASGSTVISFPGTAPPGRNRAG